MSSRIKSLDIRYWLITEKVQKELVGMSPNLRAEILDIKASANYITVIFKNGSKFSASVSGEGARGLRSTVLIIDEFRLVSQDDINQILVPTEHTRETPFTKIPKYSHLIEEPKEIYLSSAYYKSHWMWQHIKKTVSQMYEDKAFLFATDFATTLKHGIKTKTLMERARKLCKSVEQFDMEYNNLMVGGIENQYYSFDLISNAQKIKKAWYPKTKEEYFDNSRKKRFGDIELVPNEIRIVAMDIALSETTSTVKNDFSVIKCIRCILNSTGTRYIRKEVYTEAFNGMSIDDQAIRLRQIYNDFQATYIVFDARTYGTNLVDSMAKVLYDEERDCEYTPIRVMNNETLKKRCKNDNAPEIMWAFIGGAESNNSMHTCMKSSLTENRYEMLINSVSCIDDYLGNKKEYTLSSPEGKSRLEMPYINSDLTLNEMINLSMSFVQGGKIKLVEPNNGTKDKYVTSAMGNLFVQEELEVKLSKESKDNDLIDYCLF